MGTRMKYMAMTFFDRNAETVRATFAGLSLPGNHVDVLAVCFDRADEPQRERVRAECKRLGITLREASLVDDYVGPRCPSRAWNLAYGLIPEATHCFSMSSDVVLAPRAIDMAYYYAQILPNHLIIARAEHSGSSYFWNQQLVFSNGGNANIICRTMTCSYAPSPLGFAWLMPMKEFRQIGGFDEIYMGGYCYEDDDFVLRLWNAGVDFVFIDDIVGFHLEHKRDHLRDEDGRVSINAKIFKDRWGRQDAVRGLTETLSISNRVRIGNIGLGFWLHNDDEGIISRVNKHQFFYGKDEPWRAIVPKESYEAPVSK